MVTPRLIAVCSRNVSEPAPCQWTSPGSACTTSHGSKRLGRLPARRDKALAGLDDQHLATGVRVPVRASPGLEKDLVHGNLPADFEHRVLVHTPGEGVLGTSTGTALGPSVTDFHAWLSFMVAVD